MIYGCEYLELMVITHGVRVFPSLKTHFGQVNFGFILCDFEGERFSVRSEKMFGQNSSSTHQDIIKIGRSHHYTLLHAH